MTEVKPNPEIEIRCRAMDNINLMVDDNGSLITLEPADWFVCFVPGLLKQFYHSFVHSVHKHVFAMRPAGQGRWTLFEPWWHRLLTATITSEQAEKFLLWGSRGDVLLVREHIPGRGSQMRGWMNCAALCTYLLGRPYWVWTPHGLYNRLLREPNVCRVDVRALLRLGVDSINNWDSRTLHACVRDAKPLGASILPGGAIGEVVP